MPHHVVHIKPGKKQHNIVEIKASKKQLTKLRKGHAVRITGAERGQGFNLIVSPESFDLATRTFSKGRGMQLKLSPEEINANKEHAHKLEGRGIFGHKFDKFVEKNIGKNAKNALYGAVDKHVKEPLKQGIDTVASYAPELGATALSGLAVASGNPELVPMAAIAGHHLGNIVGRTGSHLAKDFLDNPSRYQSNVGGPRNTIAPATLAGQVAQNELLGELNNQLGTNMGYLGQANLANAVAQKARTQMNSAQVEDAFHPYGEGSGLWAGAGPPSSGYGIHHRRRREIGSVGKNGSFVSANSHLPPALMSQPFSANFHFQNTLPPAYQKFSKGAGLYL